MTIDDVRNKIEDTKSIYETIPIEVINDLLTLHYGKAVLLESVAVELNNPDMLWAYLSNGERESIEMVNALLSACYQRTVYLDFGGI